MSELSLYFTHKNNNKQKFKLNCCFQVARAREEEEGRRGVTEVGEAGGMGVPVAVVVWLRFITSAWSSSSLARRSLFRVRHFKRYNMAASTANRSAITMQHTAINATSNGRMAWPPAATPVGIGGPEGEKKKKKEEPLKQGKDTSV